jgi:hypothetical protein
VSISLSLSLSFSLHAISSCLLLLHFFPSIVGKDFYQEIRWESIQDKRVEPSGQQHFYGTVHAEWMDNDHWERRLRLSDSHTSLRSVVATGVWTCNSSSSSSSSSSK